MTNSTSTPSTTPPYSKVVDNSFDPPVVVDWPAIYAKWDALKKETVMDTVARFIQEAVDANASIETITSLRILSTNLRHLHFGGSEALKEKK